MEKHSLREQFLQRRFYRRHARWSVRPPSPRLRQDTLPSRRLPRFIRRRNSTRRFNFLKNVIAFTGAHSITLTLMAPEIVRLPSRLVESVIAVSVALAAANNLWPMFRGKGWIVAFGFGLIHGFGFANVLGDLGLSKVSLAVPLLGFNVGVELGQLGIVTVFLPLAYELRRSWFYQIVTFKFGSAVVILIAMAWMVERMFELKLMPF